MENVKTMVFLPLALMLITTGVLLLGVFPHGALLLLAAAAVAYDKATRHV